jgi:raffinose/stachyose/melibiose transport system substrate-binding protein
LPTEDIGILSFPVVPGGKGKPTDTLGGVNGFLVSKSAPQAAVDFLKFFSQENYAKEAAATSAYIPVVKGAEAAITDPLQRRLADDLAASTYHQNFFDQDLGPSVGRVINDVSVAVAAGQTTPEAATAAIQEAADQQ